MVYQNGAGPSLIVSGLNQRVYPKPIAQVRTNQWAYNGSCQTLPSASKDICELSRC